MATAKIVKVQTPLITMEQPPNDVLVYDEHHKHYVKQSISDADRAFVDSIGHKAFFLATWDGKNGHWILIQSIGYQSW